jgi:hypothetical protein
LIDLSHELSSPEVAEFPLETSLENKQTRQLVTKLTLKYKIGLVDGSSRSEGRAFGRQRVWPPTLLVLLVDINHLLLPSLQ